MDGSVRHRTIFISDVHLGTLGCQAEILLDFLSKNQADTIYLIGDIIDAWRLRRGWFWPQSHNDVVQELLSRAHDGAKIFYIPGNHDEMLRNYLGTHFGGVEVVETAPHTTADGRRLLVTHGDQFDSIVVNAKWLAHVGDRAYEFALWLNTWVNRIKRLWGGQYWSLSKWAKHQVKQAVSFISEYEHVLADEARRNGYDGVVCGHIHSACIRKIDGLDYINTGDWVESCTAVVEHMDGSLHLIDWAEHMRTGVARPARRKAGRRTAALTKDKEVA
ncbi:MULTISPECIES: UDP-2,3-diacylglucosamine diphosphatase [Roseobacteraceae]|jgi:UDP-2,3-diacylglucosamine pyrophosphatase LpxH|uniref:UDP-2,3-diacylglucosamine hydrolase n=1 Tax=Pseudosulfitobacter pseudonitzschiae TaxID=1402135 RepID=A0A221JZV9_9RHOB|nr:MULTISPECIES: UDP-2,3-diacylglucosamine diphosphatase [Roseobacteraceae]ASM72298.1 UDP-2,3-diacylglucosamine hydrolase [Pseudosulfitobacter pseudonitzschiae]